MVIERLDKIRIMRWDLLGWDNLTSTISLILSVSPSTISSDFTLFGDEREERPREMRWNDDNLVVDLSPSTILSWDGGGRWE